MESQQASPLCKLAVTTMFAADGGVSTGWQSLLGILTLIQGGGGKRFWEETERYRCAEGNQALATKLADAVLKENGHIRLDTEIRQVQVDERIATITLADGTTLEGDDVVLTAPPSTWNRIRFKPRLPATLTPQMGTNIKFLAHLRERVWKKSHRTPNALSDGPVNMTWESTSAQAGDRDVCMVGFSGAGSADICRAWPAGERQENYSKLLERWYPGFGAALVKSQLMDWPSDRWTKASYSFPAPGQVTSIGPTLYDGLGRLHFAGEHTCYAFPGYMEGALQSGARLANRIAVRDGLIKA
jgi:monoamine oxidase